MELIKWNTQGRKKLNDILTHGEFVEVEFKQDTIILNVNNEKYELSEMAHRRLIETCIFEKI